MPNRHVPGGARTNDPNRNSLKSRNLADSTKLQNSENRDKTHESGTPGVHGLTARQLEILQHAVGADRYGQCPEIPYRNHFCAGGEDEVACRELVALGFMRVFHPNATPLPYYNCAVTVAGMRAMKAQSAPPPKLTRSQQRYRAFLAADCGLKFGQWLRFQAGAR